MSKYSKKLKVSEETQEEALAVARATQKPGQTKEQTKLISQGIQKGIDQYKKQHKAKSRELNKQLKKVKNTSQIEEDLKQSEVTIIKQHWLPWVLLLSSWTIFLAYIFIAV